MYKNIQKYSLQTKLVSKSNRMHFTFQMLTHKPNNYTNVINRKPCRRFPQQNAAFAYNIKYAYVGDIKCV